MRDFLETEVAYYILKAKSRQVTAGTCQVRTSQRSTLFASGNEKSRPMQDPFRKMVQATGALMEEATLFLASSHSEEEEALDAALHDFDAEMDSQAQEMLTHIQQVSATVLPLAHASHPLDMHMLEALNEHIRGIESHFGANAGKSDALPDSLLGAKPGSKLYPGLVKKLETICGRSLAELRGREAERCRAQLIRGGLHQSLDARRKLLAESGAARKEQFASQFAPDLSDSDHLPVYETLHLGAWGLVRMVTWNVLEFPCPRSTSVEQVYDGVRPVCDMLLNSLDRKGEENMGVMLEVLGSDAAITHHTERVLTFVRKMLADSGSADIVLLQEVGEPVKESLMDLCVSNGWSAHFSTKISDPKRCDAMTAVLARRSSDEVAEFTLQRNKKVRNFAAARFGTTWVVSVHLPLKNSQKETEDLSDSHGSYTLKVLQQLWHHFGNPEGTEVLAGGDWNDALHSVFELATVHPAQGCRSISLHAPDYETTLNGFLDDESLGPIDGFFMLR